MGDFSDESDINPSEMERMVQDLDDLDNTLLGGPSKKQDPFTNGSKDKEATNEGKKRVVFKGIRSEYGSNKIISPSANMKNISDFDGDDPLADLLSDHDDDASHEFKKPNASTAKSNLVADLFGIKSEKPEEKKTEATKQQKPSTVQSVEASRESIIADESLSLNKKPSATVQGRPEDSQMLPNAKARKSSLMEDLFGARSRSAPTKEIDSRPILPKSSIPKPSIPAFSEPPKSEASIKSSSGYVVDFGSVREPRRGRKNSAVISDPLGLFSTPTKPIEPVAQTPVYVSLF